MKSHVLKMLINIDNFPVKALVSNILINNTQYTKKMNQIARVLIIITWMT